MLHIEINGRLVSLGQTLPKEITSLKVRVMLGAQISVPKRQVPQIKRWLNSVVDKCTCEWIEYNGALMPKSELIKFSATEL